MCLHCPPEVRGAGGLRPQKAWKGAAVSQKQPWAEFVLDLSSGRVTLGELLTSVHFVPLRNRMSCSPYSRSSYLPRLGLRSRGDKVCTLCAKCKMLILFKCVPPVQCAIGLALGSRVLSARGCWGRARRVGRGGAFLTHFNAFFVS